jgi:DNA-directed RNA polymerase subunit RPC12/RpoP
MKFFIELMMEEYLNEQSFTCPKCGHKFESEWKGKAKCKKCGTQCKMSESINEAPIAAKGWSQKSIEKFGKTIGKGPKEKGFFDACVKRMEGKMGDKSKGFCASIKDAAYGSPNWRGKGKSKKEVASDTKKKRFPKNKQLPTRRNKKKK